MKTFELPVSDTGHFVGGVLTDDTIAEFRSNDAVPKYGVIVWYRDKETARQALKALMDSHWGETKS